MEKKVKLVSGGRVFTFSLSHAKRILKGKDALKRWEIAEGEKFELVGNDIKPRKNKKADSGPEE